MAPRSGSPNVACMDRSAAAAAVRDEASMQEPVLLDASAKANANGVSGDAVSGECGTDMGKLNAENGRWVSRLKFFFFVGEDGEGRRDEGQMGRERDGGGWGG